MYPEEVGEAPYAVAGAAKAALVQEEAMSGSPHGAGS